jgi:long-chain fatty acid transport protein
MQVHRVRWTLALAAILFSATDASPAGFGLIEHAAGQLGTAYAGAGAAGEDASTIADNPAGLVRLSRPELLISGTIGVPFLPFKNSGSSLATGAPTPGSDANGGSVALLPNVFASTNLRQDLAVGLGLFPSFGLATNYPADWVGRYHAQSTNLTSFDIAPTVAYRIAPIIAIGFSPVARYTKVKFSNAIDFGTLGAGFGIPGAIPGAADGSIKIKASDWSFGFNGGVLLEPAPTTRIGFTYFYNNAAHLSGSAGFARPGVGDIVSAASGAFVDTSAAGSIHYPNRASLAVVQQLSPDLDVRAGVAWTQWSSFKEQRVSFGNPNQPDAVTLENWRDTYSFAGGITYAPAPLWKLRFGISYDQTPIRNAIYRTPRLPDADRITPAIGVGYDLTDATTIDFAYQHIFGGTVGLNIASASSDRLVGKTDFSVDVVALQLTFRY